MKLLLFVIALMTTAALADETTDQSNDKEPSNYSQSRLEHATEDTRVVVITDAEFVPFSQYLGLSEINTLPPSSAGNHRQHRTP